MQWDFNAYNSPLNEPDDQRDNEFENLIIGNTLTIKKMLLVSIAKVTSQPNKIYEEAGSASFDCW